MPSKNNLFVLNTIVGDNGMLLYTLREYIDHYVYHISTVYIHKRVWRGEKQINPNVYVICLSGRVSCSI